MHSTWGFVRAALQMTAIKCRCRYLNLNGNRDKWSFVCMYACMHSHNTQVQMPTLLTNSSFYNICLSASKGNFDETASNKQLPTAIQFQFFGLIATPPTTYTPTYIACHILVVESSKWQPFKLDKSTIANICLTLKLIENWRGQSVFYSFATNLFAFI